MPIKIRRYNRDPSRWQVDVYVDPHRGPRWRRVSPYEGYNESREWAKQLLAELVAMAQAEDDEAPEPAEPSPAVRTLEEAFERWLEHGEAVGRNGRKWSPRYAKECARMARYLASFELPKVGRLGELPVDKVRDSAEDLVLALVKDQQLANRTVNHYIEALRGATTTAARAGWIEDAELPVEMLDTKRSDKWINETDLARCLLMCDRLKNGARSRVVWLLGARAGLRLGEMRGLRWGDLEALTVVDYDTGEESVYPCLIIRSTIPANSKKRKLPKGGRVRAVPLHPDVSRALGQLAAAWNLRLEEVASQPVLSRTNLPPSARTIHHPVRDVSERAKVTCMITDRAARESRASKEPVSPHVLRHSFSTHLRVRGVARSVISELLGHAASGAPAVTEVYLHEDLSAGLPAKAAAIARLPPWTDALEQAPKRTRRKLSLGDLENPGGGAARGSSRGNAVEKSAPDTRNPRYSDEFGGFGAPATGLETPAPAFDPKPPTRGSTRTSGPGGLSAVLRARLVFEGASGFGRAA